MPKCGHGKYNGLGRTHPGRSAPSTNARRAKPASFLETCTSREFERVLKSVVVLLATVKLLEIQLVDVGARDLSGNHAATIRSSISSVEARLKRHARRRGSVKNTLHGSA